MTDKPGSYVPPKSPLEFMRERARELFPCVMWEIVVDALRGPILIEGVLGGESFGTTEEFHCQWRIIPHEAVEMFENEDDEDRGKYRFRGMTVEQIVFLLKGEYVPERHFIKWKHRDWFDHILRGMIEDLSRTAFAFGRKDGVV